MSERDIAVNRWTTWAQTKEEKQFYRSAITGDGSSATNCDVAGRPGWAWVRYDEKQDKASQVRNRWWAHAPQNVPVLVGKRYPRQRELEIIGINWELYDLNLDDADVYNYGVPQHGPSHNAIFGADPAWMDVNNMLNGRARQTDPASMSVYVESLYYEYGGQIVQWPGGAIDLTASVPGWGHRYVLVYIDVVTNTLNSFDGLISPLAIAPDIPEMPETGIPICLVDLETGATTVTVSDIYDRRILFGTVGAIAAEASRQALLVEHWLDFEISRHQVEGM